MARVQVLGPRPLEAELLRFVQAQGALELRASIPEPGDAAPPAEGAPALARTAEAKLEDAIRRIDALRARLPPPGRDAARPDPLPDPESPELEGRLAALEADLAALDARRAGLAEEREATSRFTRIVVALAPLPHGLDPSLGPELHGLVLHPDPAAVALLEAEVRRITGDACDFEAKPMDAEHVGVLVAVPRAHGRALSALLSERGVDEVRLPAAYSGKTVVETLLLLASRERILPDELAAVDAERVRLAGVAPALEGALAAARSALGRLRALRRCGETRFAFVVSGYTPEERVPALRAAAAAIFGDRVAVLARPPTPREWHDVPVVLRNARWLRPFQLLLALVPLPRYGSIDPTPWLALFYPLLLGVVLGDVALGALGLLVALTLRRRKVGGPVGADVAWVALWCSASVAIFGLAYGEALGDLGAHFGLRPLLLDRRNATMVFLGMALAVGAVHVGTGIALGVVVAARGGHGREAAARAAKLAMLVAGAAAGAALAGALPRGAVGPALLAGGVALVGAVIAEGPMAALDVVLGLGNVLSYARLMALGLAAVMLAEVATMIARTLEPAALGLAIGVMLHAVNCSLGLISPMIAALRLHYVEFFEKFYDEGGEPYRPFALAA